MRRRALAAGMAAMMLALTACSGGSSAPETKAEAKTEAPKEEAKAEEKAEEKTEEKAEAAPASDVVWPFTDKETTFYTRNNAGSATTLAQQYLLDIVFDGSEGTNLLVSDATSGGAVCVEKTYAAGGDGYTFYVSGSEMVIGDILGTFDYSLKDDFQVLGMVPSNGAPNF